MRRSVIPSMVLNCCLRLSFKSCTSLAPIQLQTEVFRAVPLANFSTAAEQRLGGDLIQAAGDFSHGAAVERTLQARGQIAAAHFDESFLQGHSLLGLYIENTLRLRWSLRSRRLNHMALAAARFGGFQQVRYAIVGRNTWQLFGGITLVAGKIVQRIALRSSPSNALPLHIRCISLDSPQGDGHEVAFEQRLYRVIQLGRLAPARPVVR